jgi:uncharacterized membrane protein YecN with MAPEG domain
MSISIVCIALLGLLLFGLGLGVSAQRGRSSTNFGFKDDPADPLYRWVRAHGNTAEFAPMLAVLFFVVGWRGSSPWVNWVIALATLSRYLIAAGIVSSTLARPNPLRFAGALGTYVCGLILSIYLLAT